MSIEAQENVVSISPDKRLDNPYKRITRRIDSTKIRKKHKRDLDVKVSVAGDMNVVKDVPVRAGAIIYTKEGDTTYYCLGIDTESGNLTDFGGGVKKGETIVEGGLRELAEESRGVFGPMTPDGVKDSVIFSSYNMAIMFIYKDVNMREIQAKFNNSPIEIPEVSGIVWLTESELMESIHGRGRLLYVRVRKLLSKVTSTITEL